MTGPSQPLVVPGSPFCSATPWLFHRSAPTSRRSAYCPEKDVLYMPRTPPERVDHFSILRYLPRINTIGSICRKGLFSAEPETHPERTMVLQGLVNRSGVNGSAPVTKCTVVFNRNCSLRDGLQAWFKTFIINAGAHPVFRWGDLVLIPGKGCHLLNPCYDDCMLWPSGSRPLAGSQARRQSQNKFQGKAENRLVKTKLFSLLLSTQPKDVLLTEHLQSHNNF